MHTSLDYSKLDICLERSDHFIHKNYMQNLHQLSICNPPKLSIEHIKLLKLSSSTCSSFPDSMVPLLSALHSLSINIVYIIEVTSSGTSTYLGVQHPKYSSVGIEILKNGLLALDPNLALQLIPPDELQLLLEDCLFNVDLYNAITCTTFCPNYTQTIPPFKPLLTAMKEETYTLLWIAEPIDFTTYLSMQTQLEVLHNDLFSFKEISFSSTRTTTDSLTDSTSHSHNEQENTTRSDNQGASSSHTLTNSCNDNRSFTLKPHDILSYTNSDSQNRSHSDTENKTTNEACSSTNQFTCTRTKSDSDTRSNTNTHVTTHRVFYRQVATLLTECEHHLEICTSTLTMPMFQFATYFLSSSMATSVRAASTYMYTLTQNTPCTFPKFINTWTKEMPSFCEVLHYLSTFSHPQFHYSYYQDFVTPTLPWSISPISILVQK